MYMAILGPSVEWPLREGLLYYVLNLNLEILGPLYSLWSGYHGDSTS